MTPEARIQTVHALRAAAKMLAMEQLPKAAPKTKGEARFFLDSLSDDEKKILNHLAGVTDAPAVYGTEDGDYLALIKTEPNRTQEKPDLGRVARNLEKAGWLRTEPEGEGRYYWLSDAAAALLESLGTSLEAASISAMPWQPLFHRAYGLMKEKKRLEARLALVHRASSPDDYKRIQKDIDEVQRQLDRVLEEIKGA
jgi:hypothetical protein